ncbi:hypothetical protein [Vibrio taketomensis]|uniref:hypothetical protein n=1 Tax=Vibrio taketomensis TaxID=2572923 RepID=UPI00138A50D7|nr:hypothetical protein [Vibrio taketomensis]
MDGTLRNLGWLFQKLTDKIEQEILDIERSKLIFVEYEKALLFIVGTPSEGFTISGGAVGLAIPRDSIPLQKELFFRY